MGVSNKGQIKWILKKGQKKMVFCLNDHGRVTADVPEPGLQVFVGSGDENTVALQGLGLRV